MKIPLWVYWTSGVGFESIEFHTLFQRLPPNTEFVSQQTFLLARKTSHFTALDALMPFIVKKNGGYDFRLEWLFKHPLPAKYSQLTAEAYSDILTINHAMTIRYIPNYKSELNQIIKFEALRAGFPFFLNLFSCF